MCFVLLCNCLFTTITRAQFFSKAYFELRENNVEKKLAWAGGLNAPQFSQLDLDADGKKELIVFDRTSNKISAYRHLNGLNYQYFDLANGTFPDSINEWMLLRDYNGDGKEDIFTSGLLGDIRIYKNKGAEGFELVSASLNSFYQISGSSFTTTLTVLNSDLPVIDDLDNDGDLDILSFTLSGATVEYHKNFSKERTGVAGLDFELRNRCWGYFEEGFADNSLELAVKNCISNTDNPDKYFKHTGSSLLALDLTGDGKKDLLLGDITFNNLVQVNMGVSSFGGDSAVNQVTNFPSNAPVNLPVFPAAYYLDLDFDGRKELLVAPNNKNSINNYKSVWLYRNVSNNATPQFELLQKDFLQKDMIEWGENSSPLLHDLDADGRLDLLIGGRGISEGQADFKARLIYYRNIGTENQAVFSLENDNLYQLSETGIGSNTIVSFGQLDQTPELEMIVGDVGGKIHLFSKNAQGNYQLSKGNLTDDKGAVIDVGDFANPVLWDVNKDGLLDLIIGERLGNLNFYLNIGSASQPIFQKTSENWGNANANEFSGDNGFSTPFVFNENGKDLLLVGSRNGAIRLYEITASGNNFPLLSSRYGNINEGYRTAPCMGDLNNDGIPDLIVGTLTGGLVAYAQSRTIAVNELEKLEFKIYPNPGSKVLNISSNCQDCQLMISDISGKLILAQNLQTAINIEALQAGMYFISIQNQTQKSTLKFIKTDSF